MKQIIIVFAIFLGPFILIYGGMWIGYQGIDQENKKNFISNVQFRGKIWLLDIREFSCFTHLVVKLNDDRKIGYGISSCGNGRDFVRFAVEGDSIIKNLQSSKVEVIKHGTQESRTFEFPF